ncbi:nicotinate-nucleotide--dimethylbenzimidazole phosphoribosyltransferase [Kitasatospora sp. NPDC054939]
MTDGGHVPNEGLPEHLLAGPDPLGGPEGVAVPVVPGQGVPVVGAAGVPVVAPPLVPGQGAPAHGTPAHGTPAHGIVAQGYAPDGTPLTAPPQTWGGDPAAPRPAFHFLDQPDQLDDEDDVLLMPGPQAGWGEQAAGFAPAGEHAEGVPAGTPVEPSWPPLEPPVLGAVDPQAVGPQPVAPQPVDPYGAAQHAVVAEAGAVVTEAVQVQVAQPVPPQVPGAEAMTAAQPPRRPLHAGPPIPDPSLMTGQVPVRSLADRGPSQATPAHGIPVVGPQGVPVAPVPQQVAPQVAQPLAPQTFPQPVPVAQPVPPVAGAPLEAVAEAQPAVEQAAPEQAFAPQPVEQQAVEQQVVAPQPVEQPVAEVPAVEQPAAGAVAVEPVADAAQPVEAAVAAEPTVEVPVVEAAPAPQPRRISAFLAAPTPHGLPPVEATADAAAGAPVEQAPEQAAAIAVADPAEAVPVEAVQVAAEAVQPEAAQPQEPQVQDPQPADVPVAEQAVAEQPVAVEQTAEPQPAAEQPAVEQVAEPQAADAVEAPAPEAAPPADAAQPVEAVAAVEAQPQDVPQAEGVAETAAGTGEMAAGEPVAVPDTEQAPVVPQPVEPQPVDPQSAAQQAVDPQAVDPQSAEQQPAEQGPADATAPEAPVAEGGSGPAPTAEAAPVETVEEAPAAAAEAAAEVQPAEVQPDADAAPAADGGPEADGEAEPEPAEPRGPAAAGYDDLGREAVHQVIRERRDIRNGFRPDPIPHEVLIRVLEAAHTAPSVGYSQPWDFVVIRSAKTRRRMHELAERQREAYAQSLPKGRAKQFKEIKTEAILETPVNIVVTADRTRGGRHTLGRHTQPQMAPYSAALAVENLWLAARAEGLGVGWVSFFDEEELVRELGLPEHLDVVAYLCVGFVDAFPDEPELQQQGWARKRPLSWVVHEEQYGNRALPGEEAHDLLSETLRGIRPLDAKALGEAWDRQKRMTKPAGSLGMLEIISAQLSGLSRKCPPPMPEPACVAIFAGDHGVHAQGVTPWPQEVTTQMVGNFLAGGAVVNAFARQIGTEVCVVDVGVASELPEPIQQGRTTGLLPRKVKPGTDDMTQGPAMTREEALKAIEVGIETARDLVAAGNKALVTGDMGIANTTASAALISVFTGLDPAEVTGRGTGIDDETHSRKVEVVRAALALHKPDPADPIGVLAAVGGLEHAAIAGFLLGAASLRTPVVLDGVIAGSAALAAKAIAPEVLAACIAGHRSAEPGHQAALAKLGLRPLIDLDLRLGEGTGALLALPLVQSAARAMHDVATFDSAGVTEKA